MFSLENCVVRTVKTTRPSITFKSVRNVRTILDGTEEAFDEHPSVSSSSE